MWKRFLVQTIFSSAVFYAMICVAIAVAVHYGHRDRLLNVRDFPTKYWGSLVGNYLSQYVDPNAVLFVGSSFSYGYPFAADLSAPAQLAPLLDRPVINATIIGSTMIGFRDYIFCQMKERGLRVKIVILEIPLINETSNIAKNPSSWGEMRCPTQRMWSEFEMVARLPALSSWWPNLRDTYRNAREDYPDVVIVPVADDYFVPAAKFETTKGELKARINTYISEASEFADEVYAFVTPVYGEGVMAGGQDRSNVERQFEFGQEVCKTALGVHCINMKGFIDDRSMYTNLTHFSIRGNAAFADHIRKTMESR